MEAQNISVGLDIGTTKIVAMIGRKNEYDKLEILGIGKSKSLGVHRGVVNNITCLLYTSPSPRDRQKSRMPSSA